jgi:predicted GNAT family acetyltransferase
MSIRHDKDNNQFTLQLQGLESVLQYRFLGDDSVDFFRTYVPPALRGRGHAARLVDAGFAWARERKLNIESSCWYAAKRLADAQE